MLIRFTSTKTESITMFGDVAVQLIRMLGASGAIPGAIGAADIPAAIARLRQELQAHAASDAPAAGEDGDKVGLSTRALPLIDLLRRASAADVPVMWETV